MHCKVLLCNRCTFRLDLPPIWTSFKYYFFGVHGMNDSVTGANKGIGFEIVRGLCKKIQGHVLLGARNEELGKAAVKKLEEEGLKAEFVQLDVTSKDSIERAMVHILNTYGGLDILVNNAGIAFKMSSTATLGEQAEVTMNVNYFGLLEVCNAMFPLLRSGARVVNVASSLGKLLQVSKELQDEFSRPGLTVPELSNLMNEFVKLAKHGSHEKRGFSDSAYGMSKVAVIALTRIHGREMAQDPRGDILVTSVCPGFVKTDLTSNKGHLTPEEGADTPIFLALLPKGTKLAQGQFFRKRKILNWLDLSPAED